MEDLVTSTPTTNTHARDTPTLTRQTTANAYALYPTTSTFALQNLLPSGHTHTLAPLPRRQHLLRIPFPPFLLGGPLAMLRRVVLSHILYLSLRLYPARSNNLTVFQSNDLAQRNPRKK